MTRDDLNELEDPDCWDWDAAEVLDPIEAPSAIVSVRLSTDEFERVSERAKQDGITVSQFVRATHVKAGRKVGHEPG